MKYQTLTQIITASSITLSSMLVAIQPGQAQSTTFYCGMTNGVPTTLAQTPRGTVAVIRWVSSHFSGSGYSPEVRCQEVSGRFQTYYNQGILNYITSGIMNGQPVICVSGTSGGGCSGLLFTLKPGESASRKLQQLFDVRQGAAGPLYESSQNKVSIDFNNYLETAPLENAASTPNNPVIEPTTPPTNTTPTDNNNSGGNIW